MPRTQPVTRAPRVPLLLTICLVVAALYFARDVLIPLALALSLSFLLTPVVNRVERLRIGRPAAVIIVAILAFSVIGILGYVVADQVMDLASHIDQYKGNILAKVEQLRPSGGGLFTKLTETAKEIQQQVDGPATQTGVIATRNKPLPVAVIPPETSPLQTLGTYVGLALGPLGTLGIVIVFVVFMLLQREDLRNRLIRLVGQGQLTVTTQALDDASTRISRYLVAQSIVNGTYGAAIALGLWVIGLTLGDGTAFPAVILWGLLCALLRFIPYIGPWIGATFPLAIAAAVYPGFGVFAATIGLFVVIELISNNLMEPVLYGASTGISTLAVLVAAVFWTWLWGPIGLLLSTPLTVILVVLGKYVTQLQFLDVLLGDEPVLTPAERMYQRLLALDPEESTDLAREYWEKESLESVYDAVLMPALAMAEQDRHAGQLDDRRDKFVRQTIRDIIDELGDEERTRNERHAAAATAAAAKRDESAPPVPAANGNGSSSPAPAMPPRRSGLPAGCTINVVCLPAHDPADEICNLMLTQLLELRGYRAVPISQDALASEMIEAVTKHEADIVVISALPPSAVAHARYLCKRLTGRIPELNLTIGLWLSKADPKKVRQRIGCVENVGIALTLHEMLEKVTQMSAPLIAGSKRVEGSV